MAKPKLPEPLMTFPKAACAAFLPDARSIALGEGGAVVARDLQGVELWRSKKLGKHLAGVFVSPDGRRLATWPNRGEEVILVDPVSGERQHSFGTAGTDVIGPVFAKTGEMLYADLLGKKMYCADLTTGKSRTANIGGGKILSLAMSADGGTLAAITSSKEYEKSLLFFDFPSLKPVRTESVTGAGLALSPDGSFAAVCGDGNLLLVPVKRGKAVKVAVDDDFDPYVMTISPDGRWLATCLGDNFTRIFDLESRTQAAKLDMSDIDGFAFSPDCRLLALSSLRNTRVWELAALVSGWRPPTGGGRDDASKTAAKKASSRRAATK